MKLETTTLTNSLITLIDSYSEKFIPPSKVLARLQDRSLHGIFANEFNKREGRELGEITVDEVTEIATHIELRIRSTAWHFDGICRGIPYTPPNELTYDMIAEAETKGTDLEVKQRAKIAMALESIQLYSQHQDELNELTDYMFAVAESRSDYRDVKLREKLEKMKLNLQDRKCFSSQ